LVRRNRHRKLKQFNSREKKKIHRKKKDAGKKGQGATKVPEASRTKLRNYDYQLTKQKKKGEGNAYQKTGKSRSKLITWEIKEPHPLKKKDKSRCHDKRETIG